MGRDFDVAFEQKLSWVIRHCRMVWPRLDSVKNWTMVTIHVHDVRFMSTTMSHSCPLALDSLGLMAPLLPAESAAMVSH